MEIFTEILSIFLADQLLHKAVGCAELGILDKEVSTNPAVTGAIGKKQHFKFWKDTLKAPKDILNIVR